MCAAVENIRLEQTGDKQEAVTSATLIIQEAEICYLFIVDIDNLKNPKINGEKGNTHWSRCNAPKTKARRIKNPLIL